MIDELRVYRMHPGKVEEYLALSQNVAIPFTRTIMGKCRASGRLRRGR